MEPSRQDDRRRRRVRRITRRVEWASLLARRAGPIWGVAVLASLVGVFLAWRWPGLVPPTPWVGAGVAFGGLAAGLLLAGAADATDRLVRGARHVTGVGAELVGIVPPEASSDSGASLAATIADAIPADGGVLKVALTAARTGAFGVSPWTEALGMAIAQQGASVLVVDLVTGLTDRDGAAEVGAGRRKLGDVARLAEGLRYARIGPGRDHEQAIVGLGALMTRLPRDLEVVLVALPPMGTRDVVEATLCLDTVLVVAEKDRTTRLELMSALEAVARVRAPAQVVLFDGQLAEELGHVPGAGASDMLSPRRDRADRTDGERDSDADEAPDGTGQMWRRRMTRGRPESDDVDAGSGASAGLAGGVGMAGTANVMGAAGAAGAAGAVASGAASTMGATRKRSQREALASDSATGEDDGPFQSREGWVPIAEAAHRASWDDVEQPKTVDQPATTTPSDERSEAGECSETDDPHQPTRRSAGEDTSSDGEATGRLPRVAHHDGAQSPPLSDGAAEAPQGQQPLDRLPAGHERPEVEDSLTPTRQINYDDSQPADESQNVAERPAVDDLDGPPVVGGRPDLAPSSIAESLRQQAIDAARAAAAVTDESFASRDQGQSAPPGPVEVAPIIQDDSPAADLDQPAYRFDSERDTERDHKPGDDSSEGLGARDIDVLMGAVAAEAAMRSEVEYQDDPPAAEKLDDTAPIRMNPPIDEEIDPPPLPPSKRSDAGPVDPPPVASPPVAATPDSATSPATSDDDDAEEDLRTTAQMSAFIENLEDRR